MTLLFKLGKSGVIAEFGSKMYREILIIVENA